MSNQVDYEQENVMVHDQDPGGSMIGALASNIIESAKSARHIARHNVGLTAITAVTGISAFGVAAMETTPAIAHPVDAAGTPPTAEAAHYYKCSPRRPVTLRLVGPEVQQANTPQHYSLIAHTCKALKGVGFDVEWYSNRDVHWRVKNMMPHHTYKHGVNIVWPIPPEGVAAARANGYGTNIVTQASNARGLVGYKSKPVHW